MTSTRSRKFIGAALLCLAIAGCSGDDDQLAGTPETIDLREPVEETVEESVEEPVEEAADDAPSSTAAVEPGDEGEEPVDEAADDSPSSTAAVEPDEEIVIVEEPARRNDGTPPVDAPSSTAPAEQGGEPVDEAADDSPSSTAAVETEEEIEVDGEPARRNDDNPPVDASNWVARTAMGSSFVEVVWSPVEGAESYTLLRLPTASADYDAIDTGLIEGAEEVYEGPEFGFIDTDVPAGEFLTYVLVANLDDAMTTPRWTEALTVSDNSPPEPITGLSATEVEDGVLLEWDPSPDDVEFASYSVSILEEDGRLSYIGGGSDVGQVRFIDDEPFTGVRTYVVTAADFHNNVSEPGQIDVSR